MHKMGHKGKDTMLFHSEMFSYSDEGELQKLDSQELKEKKIKNYKFLVPNLFIGINNNGGRSSFNKDGLGNRGKISQAKVNSGRISWSGFRNH